MLPCQYEHYGLCSCPSLTCYIQQSCQHKSIIQSIVYTKCTVCTDLVITLTV